MKKENYIFLSKLFYFSSFCSACYGFYKMIVFHFYSDYYVRLLLYDLGISNLTYDTITDIYRTANVFILSIFFILAIFFAVIGFSLMYYYLHFPTELKNTEIEQKNTINNTLPNI